MDNKIFDINGRSYTQLSNALYCLLSDELERKIHPKGFYIHPDKGFVLTWIDKRPSPDKNNIIPFTNRLGQLEAIDVNELVDILMNWLKTEEASKIVLSGWEVKYDGDGSSTLGWRLYTEDWGCIKESNSTIDHYSIGAFKPCWLWHGK